MQDPVNGSGGELDTMIVRMNSTGCNEDLYDDVARQFIACGMATAIDEKSKPATAETVSEPAGNAGVETARLAPKAEQAVIPAYTRGPRFFRRG